MRKLFFSMLLGSLAILTLSASVNSMDNVPSGNPIVQAEPGTHCSNLTYPQKGEEVSFGRRCKRLFARKAEPGAPLPNKPPTVALRPAKGKVVLRCKSDVEPRDCQPSRSQIVRLSAKSSDPDRDSLLYTFSATGGRIKGKGPTVSWDLSGVAPGTYTATVEVDDGCGCIAFTSAMVGVEVVAVQDQGKPGRKRRTGGTRGRHGAA